MSKFLKIQNYGIADLSAFIVLGMSSARGDGEKIGQFGSGSKHAMLTLMRMGLDPVICLGGKVLRFFTKEEKFQGKTFQRVGYSFDGKQEMLSFCLEFGGMDWQHVHMGIREFISNAIDAVGTSKVKIELVDEAIPQPYYTTVYIPATPEVVSYYRGLSTNFLHFDGKQNQALIKKDSLSKCRIYRKGVFVRELRQDSFYDYNFGNEVEIDESRNMDEWNCKYHALQYLTKRASAEEILDMLFSPQAKDNVLEIGGTVYDLLCLGELKKEFVNRFGDKAVIASPLMREMADFATSKGYTVKYLLNETWYNVISKALPNVLNFSNEISNGLQILEPTENAVKVRDKIWKMLETIEMTKGKKIPPVKCFRSIMTGKTQVMGFYKDGVVYMNVENDGGRQTMLEELSHYVTQANDMTREFQDYAFNVSSRLSEYLV